MRRYLLKRLVVAIPSLVIASLIIFTLPRLLPGDAVQLMLEEKAYGKDVDDLRHKLGLDRPVYIQYFAWLGQLARGDLGESLWTKRTVTEELGMRLPVTLLLGGMAAVFSIIIGIPIGVLSAVRADTLSDYAARSAAILGLSVPGFWLATLVIVLPAIVGMDAPCFTEFSKSPSAHVLQFILQPLFSASPRGQRLAAYPRDAARSLRQDACARRGPRAARGRGRAQAQPQERDLPW